MFFLENFVAFCFFFEDRERKLRSELEKLEEHRKLIKSRRKSIDLPTVAVLGYTNAGKTSLIKSLTKDQSLQPKDKLFATLGWSAQKHRCLTKSFHKNILFIRLFSDVTAHGTILPNGLSAIFIDTVGFIGEKSFCSKYGAKVNDADGISSKTIITAQRVNYSFIFSEKIEIFLKSVRSIIKTLEDLQTKENEFDNQRKLIVGFVMNLKRLLTLSKQWKSRISVRDRNKRRFSKFSMTKAVLVFLFEFEVLFQLF